MFCLSYRGIFWDVRMSKNKQKQKRLRMNKSSWTTTTKKKDKNKSIWLVSQTDTNVSGFWLVYTLGSRGFFSRATRSFRRVLRKPLAPSFFNWGNIAKKYFSKLGFSLKKKDGSTSWSFHLLADRKNNELLRKPFSRSCENCYNVWESSAKICKTYIHFGKLRRNMYWAFSYDTTDPTVQTNWAKKPSFSNLFQTISKQYTTCKRPAKRPTFWLQTTVHLFSKEVVWDNPLVTTPECKDFSTINKKHAPIENLLINLIAAVCFLKYALHFAFLLIHFDKPSFQGARVVISINLPVLLNTQILLKV